jgi:hypothetical protein
MPTQAINTNFDKPLEEDVILEQIDGKEPAVATTLKNSENIYKSFLYIKKMYTGSLSSAKILGMGNVDNVDFETITVPLETLDALVSNTSAGESSIRINNGEYKMSPKEILEIPIVPPNPSATPPIAGDLFELKGQVSYILYIKSQV